MFKKTMTALGVTLIAATPVLAFEGPFPVGEVDTVAYFDSMKNPNALDYYPDVAADVDAAIIDRVGRSDDSDARKVDVDVQITSMRLNDNPILTDDGDFNILEGIVTVRDAIGREVVAYEQITLKAEEMSVPYASTSPDKDAFYTAMVSAFADRTAEITESVKVLEDAEEARN